MSLFALCKVFALLKIQQYFWSACNSQNCHPRVFFFEFFFHSTGPQQVELDEPPVVAQRHVVL